MSDQKKRIQELIDLAELMLDRLSYEKMAQLWESHDEWSQEVEIYQKWLRRLKEEPHE